MEHELSVELQEAAKSIAEAIRQVMCEGEKDNFFIILANSEKNYFAQAKSGIGSSEICVELVSNEFIEPKFKLTESQINAINRLGWHTSENTTGGKSWISPNFTNTWKIVNNDNDRLEIANTIITVLTNAYGVQQDKVITITTVLE